MVDHQMSFDDGRHVLRMTLMIDLDLVMVDLDGRFRLGGDFLMVTFDCQFRGRFLNARVSFSWGLTVRLYLRNGLFACGLELGSLLSSSLEARKWSSSLCIESARPFTPATTRRVLEEGQASRALELNRPEMCSCCTSRVLSTTSHSFTRDQRH